MPTPPLAVVLAYRLLAWRVGPEHAEWVRDDVVRRGWLARAGIPVLLAVLVAGGSITGLLDGDLRRVGTLVLVVAAIVLFLRRDLRELSLRHQGIDLQGTPLAGADWFTDGAARRRHNLRSTAATVALVVGAFVVLALRTRP